MADEARWQRLRDRMAGLDPDALPEDILHLARAVAGVRDPTVTCEECRDQLPTYVDAEIGGLAVGPLYSQIKRHLELCPDCEAEYLELLDLAGVEDAGELPIPKEFPVPALAFLPRLSPFDYVRALAEELIAAIAPHLVVDLREIVDVFFDEVTALGGRYTLDPSFGAAMGFVRGEVPEALRFLAVTYSATQTLIETLSPQEIEAQSRAGQLQEALRREAEKAAHDMGLTPQEVRDFAEKYAELIARDPQALQELIARKGNQES